MVVNKISQGRPHSIMIRKLSELLVPGKNRPAASGGGVGSDSSPATTSPRSPLDFPRIQSPRGLKNFDLGGVGLGIVAALENSVCCTPKSGPIPVGSRRLRKGIDDDDKYSTRREVGRTVPAPAAGNLVEEIGGFLNCCHLCNKQLQGLDIYMYRGETAFCSSECRSSQIMIDEQQQKKQKKNKCRREVGRAVASVSGKSSTSPPIFSTGILAI
ncbi:unnamed protein product [Linum tenue]|uniref:FLZ-type domain-containing protein n=1 Tax=Linum tenue TaxID=586396 RepID=A0AAV0IWJ1_9ROSI|nr:unnamed protein product [Linum tenue]